MSAKDMFEKLGYEERIDKAIEYNKKNIKSQTLNNILQGEDKDGNDFINR